MPGLYYLFWKQRFCWPATGLDSYANKYRAGFIYCRPVKSAYHRLSATHLLALGQLAEKGNLAETALLSAMLVQPVALGWIEPVDAAEIIKSLQQVGLQSVADQLAEDIVKAHLLRANFVLAS